MWRIPLPGLRNIKTALAIFICVLLYHFIHRTGLIFASTAALICMQGSVERTIHVGGNRIIGTMIGGLFGILFVFIDQRFQSDMFYLVLIAFGILILIYVLNIVGKNESITIAGFVYLFIALDRTMNTPVAYAINRLVDTLVGVVVTVLVNQLFWKKDRTGEEMDYDQSLLYLKNTYKYCDTPGFGRMRGLLDRLQHPEKKCDYVHVVGTNGKGSTVQLIAEILMAAGLRVGVYTSPSLFRLNERIQINHEQISDADVAFYMTQLKKHVDAMKKAKQTPPTEFELITAMAFLYFEKYSCDVVVLEAGVGGMLDTTNIIEDSLLTVITHIGLDHTEILGDTIEAIAKQKAGVIKKKGQVVLYPQEASVCKVIEDVANTQQAQIHVVEDEKIKVISSDLKHQCFHYKGFEDLEIRLLGAHQIKNACVALEAALLLQKKFPINLRHIYEGLRNAQWMGRLQMVHTQPLVLIDGAHNQNGAQALCDSLSQLAPKAQITFVVGFLKEKDYKKIIAIAAPLASQWVTVTPNSPRARDSTQVYAYLQERKEKVKDLTNLHAALSELLFNSNENEVICIFGSLSLMGEALDYFRKEKS